MGFFICLLCGLDTLNAFPNVAELIDEVEQEIAALIMTGHTHERTKRKVTPVSRMMAERNEIVRRSLGKLNKWDETTETKEAVEIIKKELSRRSRGRRPGGYIGHGNKLPSRPTIDDACNNAVPSCDANYSFRNVTGTCNNIKNPFWGSANIGMRRYLSAEYEDGLSQPTGGTADYLYSRKTRNVG